MTELWRNCQTWTKLRAPCPVGRPHAGAGKAPSPALSSGFNNTGGTERSPHSRLPAQLEREEVEQGEGEVVWVIVFPPSHYPALILIRNKLNAAEELRWVPDIQPGSTPCPPQVPTDIPTAGHPPATHPAAPGCRAGASSLPGRAGRGPRPAPSARPAAAAPAAPRRRSATGTPPSCPPPPYRAGAAPLTAWAEITWHAPSAGGAASPSPRVPPAPPPAVGLAASIALCSGQCDLTATRAQLAVHPRGAAASPLAPADCQPAGRVATSPSGPPRLGSVPAAGACPALRRRPRARQRSPEQGPRAGLAMAAAGGDAAQVTRAGGRRGSATPPRAPRHRGGWGCSWTLVISQQLRSC